MKMFLSLGVVFLRFLGLGLLILVLGCKSILLDETSIAPRLTEPLRFANFTVSDISSPEGVSNLRNQRVYIGTENPEAEAYDWLVSDQGTNRLRVETVNDYKAAMKSNYYARTTLDMLVQGWFDRVSDTLHFIANAQPSNHSHLGQHYFEQLPVLILTGSLEGSRDQLLEKDVVLGRTLQDYTKPGAHFHLRNIRVKGNTMTFYDADNENDYLVKELARGDVNGDGIEDALIIVAGHTQGTMGWSGSCVVTRTGSEQKLKFVEVKLGEPKLAK